MCCQILELQNIFRQTDICLPIIICPVPMLLFFAGSSSDACTWSSWPRKTWVAHLGVQATKQLSDFLITANLVQSWKRSECLHRTAIPLIHQLGHLSVSFYGGELQVLHVTLKGFHVNPSREAFLMCKMFYDLPPQYGGTSVATLKLSQVCNLQCFSNN